MIPIKDNILGDRFPFVTVGLIAANFVVYFLAVSSGGAVFGGPDFHELVKYGAIPYALTHPGVHCVAGHGTAIICGKHVTGAIPAWETVFTSMFIHSSIFQILGNMLFLWIFGNTIEDTIGPIKFLGFYILGGLVALGLEVAMAPNSTAPTVGAAGAIATVLGGYALLYPQARVFALALIIFFVTVIEVPTFVMVALWFVMQGIFWATDLINPSGAAGGVAFLAQGLAFGFGLLVIKGLASRRKPVPPPHPVY